MREDQLDDLEVDESTLWTSPKRSGLLLCVAWSSQTAQYCMWILAALQLLLLQINDVLWQFCVFCAFHDFATLSVYIELMLLSIGNPVLF